MTDIVPFTEKSFYLERWPQQATEQRSDLAAMGVHFTFDASKLAFFLETVQRWFENRDEVVLLDYGTTDKQQVGCIVMEWEGCEVDTLFQDILRTDGEIIDYTIYEREEVSA